MPDAAPETLFRDTNELASDRTDLAVERTRFAYERTLMAWIRTSTSMISFGFAVYKFFQEFARTVDVKQPLISPRVLAMVLAGIGTAALLLAMWQHKQYVGGLYAMGCKKRFDVALFVAYIIAAMGVLTFGAILLHA